MAVILGTNDVKRIEESVKALDVKLSKKQWFSIWQASKGMPVP